MSKCTQCRDKFCRLFTTSWFFRNIHLILMFVFIMLNILCLLEIHYNKFNLVAILIPFMVLYVLSSLGDVFIIHRGLFEIRHNDVTKQF